MTFRSRFPASMLAVMMVLTSATAALATSSARPATKSERAAIMAAFTANDGSSSEVHGAYVSRSSSGLAVVCVRIPESRLAGVRLSPYRALVALR